MIMQKAKKLTIETIETIEKKQPENLSLHTLGYIVWGIFEDGDEDGLNFGLSKDAHKLRKQIISFLKLCVNNLSKDEDIQSKFLEELRRELSQCIYSPDDIWEEDDEQYIPKHIVDYLNNGISIRSKRDGKNKSS